MIAKDLERLGKNVRGSVLEEPGGRQWNRARSRTVSAWRRQEAASGLGETLGGLDFGEGSGGEADGLDGDPHRTLLTNQPQPPPL